MAGTEPWGWLNALQTLKLCFSLDSRDDQLLLLDPLFFFLILHMFVCVWCNVLMQTKQFALHNCLEASAHHFEHLLKL